MIERYWSLNQMLPPLEVPIKEVRNYSNRLGTSLAFDPLSRRLLTGGSDGLALWQFPPTGLLSTPVPLAAAGLEPKASVTALRWSPRGHYLAWSGTRPALDDPKKKRRGTWLVDTASGRETGALFGDAPVTSANTAA